MISLNFIILYIYLSKSEKLTFFSKNLYPKMAIVTPITNPTATSVGK